LAPQEIIDAIDAKGFSDDYDLFYVPLFPRKGHRRAKNMGYAFVNLKTPELATAFALAFTNFAFPNSCSGKLSCTKPAHWQGFEANVEHRLEDKGNEHLSKHRVEAVCACRYKL